MEHLALWAVCEGNLEDMLSKALEMDICFHKGPTVGGTWRDAFLGPLTEGINFFI